MRLYSSRSYVRLWAWHTYVSGPASVNPTCVYVEWSPQDKTAPVPPPLSQVYNNLQDNVSTTYYHCYSYEYFILLINNALETAFNNLNTLVVAGGDVLPSQQYPYMTWDSQSSSCVLYMDTLGYNQCLIANPILLYMNELMFQLMNSFAFQVNAYGDVLQTLGRNVLILCNNRYNLGLVPVTPPAGPAWNAIRVTQESSTVNNWSAITSLVWTSLRLPVLANLVSPPSVYLNGALRTQNNTNNSSAQIVSDLITGDFQYYGAVLYNPSAQYRYIALNGNTPIAGQFIVAVSIGCGCFSDAQNSVSSKIKKKNLDVMYKNVSIYISSRGPIDCTNQ
jgi:hypothetical protein